MTLVCVRVKITLPDGRQETREVQYIEYIRQCGHCSNEFETADPRQIYCSKDCYRQAKYIRTLKR